MHTIIRSTFSGETFALTHCFAIRPLMSIRKIYKLSDELPTSEEGRTSFQIEETLVANIIVHLEAPGFANNKEWATTLYEETNYPLLTETKMVPTDQSHAYISLSEKNKKKFRMRMRNLATELSKRETLDANAPLMSNPETHTQVSANIAGITAKINNLLSFASKKPLVEMVPVNVAMRAMRQMNLDNVNEEILDSINERILDLVASVYTIS